MKAVALQGDHGVGMRQRGHAPGVLHAIVAEQGGGESRVNRRHLQLVAGRAGRAVAPLKVIGVDRLRCAVEGFDALVEACRGEVRQVQEGALADALMRVRRFGAQQRRGIDTAAGEDVMLGDHADASTVRRHATFVHAQAVQADDPLALHQQAFGAGEIEQLAALVQ